MVTQKPPRLDFFDFTKQLAVSARSVTPVAAPAFSSEAQKVEFYAACKQQKWQQLQDYFAGLRQHFSESADAVTLCRFSEAGKQRFHHNGFVQHPKSEIFYRLETDGRDTRWCRYASQECLNGKPVDFPGDHQLFGRLHAAVVRVDGLIFGPQPIGTRVRLIVTDNTVEAGYSQHGSMVHVDAPSLNGPFVAVYDYIDDSGLGTRYLKGYQPKVDPLCEILGTNVMLFQHGRGDLLQRQQNSEAYRAALAAAEPRFWTAEPNTIVLRSARTPHMGQKAKETTRRAHVHLAVVRPQP